MMMMMMMVVVVVVVVVVIIQFINVHISRYKYILQSQQKDTN
jgi:uncharacterized membrane protein